MNLEEAIHAEEQRLNSAISELTVEYQTKKQGLENEMANLNRYRSKLETWLEVEAADVKNEILAFLGKVKL